MSGHDHCEEWISHEGIEYILTGNGDNCCYDATEVDAVPKDSLKFIAANNMNTTEGMTGGFASFQINEAGTVVNFHNQNGTVLFTTPTIPPRTAAMKDAARAAQTSA